MPEIITLGEILIDLFFTKIGVSPGFISAPGGAPANVAVGAAKLGKKSAFIGKVGNDQFGSFLKEVIGKNNVNISQIKTSNNVHTTLAFIFPKDDGERNFCFYRNPGADLELSSEEISEDFISGGKIFHFGSLSLTADPARNSTFKAVKCAKNAGLLISYDPNLRLSLWDSERRARKEIIEGLKVSDIVKVNREELFFITQKKSIESAIKEIFKYGLEIIFITQGKDKTAFARKGNGIYYVDSFRVKSVDATGCGDTFMGAVLVQLLEFINTGKRIDRIKNEKLKDIVLYANGAAAMTSLKIGVIPALPAKKEVEKFLKENI